MTADKIPQFVQQHLVEGKPVEEWIFARNELPLRTAEAVVAAANAMMPQAQDERLSALLDLQQAGELTSSQRSELTALMKMYQEGMLGKAQALREAVQRGLLPPLIS